jgi:hypothetical protein
MMIAAKSEDLEFSPPYPGNSSKGDAQSQTMSFSVRPEAAVRLSLQEGSNRHIAAIHQTSFC